MSDKERKKSEKALRKLERAALREAKELRKKKREEAASENSNDDKSFKGTFIVGEGNKSIEINVHKPEYETVKHSPPV